MNAAAYGVTGLLTMALTAVELLLAKSGVAGARMLLAPLMLANFGLGAAFYQGLWYDPPAYKAIFLGGLFFGLLTLFSLVSLLGLGVQ